MKRYILFSDPSSVALDEVLDLMLTTTIQSKTVGYMPPDGSSSPSEYFTFWEKKIQEHGGEIIFIDVTKRESAEILQGVQILLLTGGNTFEFLHNLQSSDLLNTLKKEFGQESNRDVVVAGFSAGAMILSPSIEIANLLPSDKNTVNLQDTDALGFVNFEVFPHFEPQQTDTLNQYQSDKRVIVKPIPNDYFIVVEK